MQDHLKHFPILGEYWTCNRAISGTLPWLINIGLLQKQTFSAHVRTFNINSLANPIFIRFVVEILADFCHSFTWFTWLKIKHNVNIRFHAK